MKEQGMTYASTGPNYADMDPHKIRAQRTAAETNNALDRFGFKVVEWSRGESCFLIKIPIGYLAFVIEGLGTKNLVADAMYTLATTMSSLKGGSYYDQVAICNAAMAFNDLITLGAQPLVYGQYSAVGSSEWFADEHRSAELIAGTKKACQLARCVWGPGESSTLKGIINDDPGTIDLAGATVGLVSSNDRLINPANIESDDVIVIVESSGIHANGLSAARQIAANRNNLPHGYLTLLSDGRTFGETLLDPTHIYAPLIEDCLNSGVQISYTVNITGHGWRKFMRATKSFAYIIEKLPTQLPIFQFLQKHGPFDDREAYGTFNMGAGFALFVKPGWEDAVCKIAKLHNQKAFAAGHIEKSPKKRVLIKPVDNLEFAEEDLAVR